ncbi:hypothetical protein AB0O07_19020 [Streptomyces sp. NPDC093085]|uniref:hypothetical protein n=1 Tax=Streptomyces sp. NPDC093085 TaxID=3155068 RepID=UPI0034449E3D
MTKDDGAGEGGLKDDGAEEGGVRGGGVRDGGERDGGVRDGGVRDGATPLLPEPVRSFPYAWDTGFGWPPETMETPGNLALARAVLEACLPPAPLAVPEPPPEVRAEYLPEGEEPPDWIEARVILRRLMPYARDVTRGRMAEAEARCARAGLDTTDFTACWTLRISAWIAEQTLRWLGLTVDDTSGLTPWAPELAELCARRGLAAEQAVWMLRLTPELPESRPALARLAADPALPPAVRELAAQGA